MKTKEGSPSTDKIDIGKDDLGIWKYPIRVILAYPNQIRERGGGDTTRVRRPALKANKANLPIGPVNTSR